MNVGHDSSFHGVTSLCDAAMEELQQQQHCSHSSAALSLPRSAAKPFTEMNATERKEYLSNEENRSAFFNKVIPMLDGALCTICENGANLEEDKRCASCGIFFHAVCVYTNEEEWQETCLACRTIDQTSSNMQCNIPQCFMCCHPNSISPLVRAYFYSKPTSIKNVEFCHALCGFWTGCEVQDKETINCTKLRGGSGKYLKYYKDRCALCGLYQGAKIGCEYENDDCVRHRKEKRAVYHVTCARQAGLQVDTIGSSYSLKCFKHVSCTFVLRAHLENLKVIELDRSPDKKWFAPNSPMTWNHASLLLQYAVCNIMRTLGWAWRWAEWWVEFGDNWEPLLEDNQDEEEVIYEEVNNFSTPESRCIDARKCHLAAFGAALRNRDYDTNDGVDLKSLEQALTEVLQIKSLVGPLEQDEIDFYVAWLALAYCSKAPLLGFGDDKTPVATDEFCIHQDDGSPKYVLGSRPLPGKDKSPNSLLRANDADDFFTPFTPPIQAGLKASRKRSPTAGSDEPSDQVNSSACSARMMGQKIYNGLLNTQTAQTRGSSTKSAKWDIMSKPSPTTLSMMQYEGSAKNVRKANADVTCGARTDSTFALVQKRNDEIPTIPVHARGGDVTRKKRDYPADWRDEPNFPLNLSVGTGTVFTSGEGKCDGLPKASAVSKSSSNAGVSLQSLGHAIECEGDAMRVNKSMISLSGGVANKAMLSSVENYHDDDSKISAQARTSNRTAQKQTNNMSQPTTSKKSQLHREDVCEGSRNDATAAGRILSVTNVNGSLRKSNASVGCRLGLLERWEGIKRNGCYTRSKAILIGELFAEVDHNDNDLVNQAFDLLDRHKNAYIEIMGQHKYLTNLADFLIKLRGHHSYNSKLTKFVEELLEVHHYDFEFINKFGLLVHHKHAFGPDDYTNKVAGEMDKLFASDVDHDYDDVLNEKFGLLERHKNSYVAARGVDIYDENVEAFLKKARVSFEHHGCVVVGKEDEMDEVFLV